MGRIVRFVVSGHGPDTDAPSVEDVLDQMRDFLDILRGVEEAASGGPSTAIVWRVVEASRNSPLTFAIQPYPRDYAINIDRRVDVVLRETSAGLATLRHRAERPKYFNDDLMRKAKRTFERVTNGLGMSVADFGPNLPKLELTATTARLAANNAETVLSGAGKSYQELGSVEGYIRGVETDWQGRRVAVVRDRMTGTLVRCIIPKNKPQLAAELAQRQIGDVWNNIRAEVSGRIYCSSNGSVDHIEADAIRFFKPAEALPRFADVVDPHFTGGMKSEDFLERIRNGTRFQ